MPRKKTEVRAHFSKTFHPVFRHLRREIVKTIVFDVLNECEAEFIDWLYYQLEEFIEFQEDGDHSDCFDEEDEEDVYVTEKGFPLAPALELDRLEEEGEHTDTSELNASAFENRSLLRNNEKKTKESEDPVSSTDSSELSADEEDEEGSSEESSHEASPSQKKKSTDTSTAQLSTSSLLSKSSGCYSRSVSDAGQSIDSSNADGSEGIGSELSTSLQCASEKAQEGSNSNSKSNSSNSCSSQYSTLNSEKLKERAGDFQPGMVKQILGNQTMNLDRVDELSISRDSSDASDT